MAVVQISKIQLRRGKKNSVSGIPQLASAEMAWAVDSQELYIGNGSVAEGAPYVGNTRILTEHENLLGLISSYQYAADDTYLEQYSVPRSIQNKLDENVSVADFGIEPGVETNAALLNNTLIQLYSNYLGSADSQYKKVLIIPNGTYNFEADLVIPSNTILRGETPFGVVLNIGEYNIRFVSDEGTEFADINSANFPNNVSISNLTIKRSTGQIVLSGLKQANFGMVTVQGEYTLNTITNDPLIDDTITSALYWENTGTEINVTDITFTKCNFLGNEVSIRALNTIKNDSDIRFDDCKFIDNYYGTIVNGIPGQGLYWKYRNCTFDKIYSNAFKSTAGRGTIICQSTFSRVGNKDSIAMYPVYPMVDFGERTGNIVVDCYSDRMQKANLQSTGSVHAVPEVLNGDKVSFVDRIFSEIITKDSFVPLAVLSSLPNTYVLNYVLRLGELTRRGELTIAIGDMINPGNAEVSVSDNFTCSTNLSITESGIVITNFEFSVSIHDNNSDGVNDTIALYYTNHVNFALDDSTIIPGEEGTISFDVSYCN